MMTKQEAREFTGGRPVLIVPYSGVFKVAGDRIMIAWKAGRESVRDINDSLPYLQKAQVIDIVTGKESSTSNDAANSTLAAINNFLLKRNITTSLETISTSKLPIGDMLLNNISKKKIVYL